VVKAVRLDSLCGIRFVAVHGAFSELVAGRKAIAVDGAGLAEFNAARIDLSGVLFCAIDAGGDAGQRLQSRRRDRLAAKATELMKVGCGVAHVKYRIADGLVRERAS